MARSLYGFLLLVCMSLPSFAQDQAVGFGGGHDRTAPVEVTADNLEVDQQTGRAELKGNVLIIQDILRLTADLVEIEYTETDGGRQIDRLIAEGDVLIVAGPDAAEGQKAIYQLGNAEIEMTGNVLLTQGENALAGERLIVNLVTGAGTVSGRVRTTFSAGGAN